MRFQIRAAVAVTVLALVAHPTDVMAQPTYNQYVERNPTDAYRNIKQSILETYDGRDPFEGPEEQETEEADQQAGTDDSETRTELWLGGRCMVTILLNDKFAVGELARTGVRSRLTALAIYAISFEKWLIASEYDPDVVRREIGQLESESIRRIRDARHWVFHISLDDGRADPNPVMAPVRQFAGRIRNDPMHHGRDLPNLVTRSESGCGAGEVPIKLATNPKGGRVYVLEVFQYRVCELQEPGMGEDLKRCDLWRIAPSDGFLPVAGRYRYKIAWPGKPPTESRMYDFSGEQRMSVVVLEAP